MGLRQNYQSRQLATPKAAKVAGPTIRVVRLARTLSQTADKGRQTTWILCPWLSGSPRERDIWTSVLSAHDLNGTLLAALPVSKRKWPNVFAGVFAVDILRTTAELTGAIKAAGIGGVINFPSISFIDGQAGEVFGRLSLGIDREIDFLERCAERGLRIAGVARSAEAAQRLLSIGVEFLVSHHGPPIRAKRDLSVTALKAITDLARCGNVYVVPMSELLKCGVRRA
jgi:predicted TIM-barrel enzyme